MNGTNGIDYQVIDKRKAEYRLYEKPQSCKGEAELQKFPSLDSSSAPRS